MKTKNGSQQGGCRESRESEDIMTPEITDLQRRRAENIIWNCAECYSFTPDFKAFDQCGQADLYWNCIIGAVRRLYDYPKLEAILRSFQQYEECDTYEGLFWLGLENAVFSREQVDRPVLADLRKAYASRYIQEHAGRPMNDLDFLGRLSLAHWQRVLEQPLSLSGAELPLLDALEFSPADNTDEIEKKAAALFLQWFHITTEEKKKRKLNFVLPSIGKLSAKKAMGRYRKFGIGYADHPENIYGGVSSEQDAHYEIKTTLSSEELRTFMETKYGKSMFAPRQVLELERSLCTGNHQNCHLLLTYGERLPAGQIQNAFEALSRKREAAQIRKNQQYYQDNIVRNRIAITKLSGNIRNSVLMHLQPSLIKANSGRLNQPLIWRGEVLDDENVFLKTEHSDMGELCVDILLDASTSQKNRQEIISTQGYIIAESLTRCGIPCRVISFCSMTGYTILRIYRDYCRPQDNQAIFDYVSNGCNRDGLAVRASHYLMRDDPYENKLLIILSDVKPNDVVRIHTSAIAESVPYENQAGIRDTALEVRRTRSDGIAVVCIFTGDDEDIPSAKLVYGKDFVRIQSFDRLADAVGRLIQNQIKNI